MYVIIFKFNTLNDKLNVENKNLNLLIPNLKLRIALLFCQLGMRLHANEDLAPTRAARTPRLYFCQPEIPGGHFYQ